MATRILNALAGLCALGLAFGATQSGNLRVGKPGLSHDVSSGNAAYYFWIAVFVGVGLWLLGKAIFADDDSGTSDGPGDVEWD